MEECKPFAVRTIHDDFKCLPAYVNQMKSHYNLLLKETYESYWITALVSKLKKTKVNPIPHNPSVSADILSNNYSIS